MAREKLKPAEAWYIIQTNPNCETKAVGEMRRAGIRAHMPRFAKVIWHRRKKQHRIARSPAMPGYVFARFPAGLNWFQLRRCQGVKGVLYSDGSPFMLDRREVAAVMRAQRQLQFDTRDARHFREMRRAGERRSIASARFSSGMKVRAAQGPLSNIIAMVKRVTSRGTVIAVGEIMGTKREIEYTDIEALELEPQIS